MRGISVSLEEVAHTLDGGSRCYSSSILSKKGMFEGFDIVLAFVVGIWSSLPLS